MRSLIRLIVWLESLPSLSSLSSPLLLVLLFLRTQVLAGGGGCVCLRPRPPPAAVVVVGVVGLCRCRLRRSRRRRAVVVGVGAAFAAAEILTLGVYILDGFVSFVISLSKHSSSRQDEASIEVAQDVTC